MFYRRIILSLSDNNMRIKWTERTFSFDFPAGIYPEIIERVRGTPARLEELIASAEPEWLTKQENGRWSMQENAGHLLDLEPLVAKRLDEYIAGATQLHAADMSNRKTYDADHNAASIKQIIHDFRQERTILTKRLDNLDETIFYRAALHPRLNVSMRLVDMLYFQCEHDDYHLARITELIKTFRQES